MGKCLGFRHGWIQAFTEIVFPRSGNGYGGPPSDHPQLSSHSAPKPLRCPYVGPRKALKASLSFRVALEAGNGGATVSGPVGTVPATRAPARAVTRRKRAVGPGGSQVSPCLLAESRMWPIAELLTNKASVGCWVPGSHKPRFPLLLAEGLPSLWPAHS